jgi:large exoprotein involved in heme utilization and adhesion
MNRSQHQWGWAINLCVLIPRTVCAQAIIPDSSQGTIVTTTNSQDFVISGGQVAGRNLFQSFDRFSVPTGGSARFDLTETPLITGKQP